jgi:2-keto-4-pentenoate hydratase/2-oxohepta-3-ene-1,7-dioic acid hydratase in catechol pathway
MKLCRFALPEDPDIARSGIYHEERVYEVDGRNARGIYDLGKVHFLAPVQRPSSIRAFESTLAGPRFSYLNPTALVGTGAELTAGVQPFALEARLAIVIQDDGEGYAAEEAEGAVLGLAVCLAFRRDHPDPVLARDLPLVVGPFVTTPNELPAPGDDGRRSYLVEIRRQGGASATFEAREATPFPELVALASASLPVRASDLILSPPLVASGHESGLPGVGAGDRIIVRIGELGAVACSLS